ncbi:MAG: ATP-binding cassette domain-containing protein [Nocardioides sp.]|uniref:Unannotated protein n=1 Tax=freshwater metagenome TaxID=449393 RepID=A0A6J6U5J3_9ZZZZ|nr:ATP-binding cassette domain-containing protein [Actinomycetota bacterium]
MKLVQVEDPAVGSFDLEDGEVGVLLGRSGAGKTVLIKKLLGLDRRLIARRGSPLSHSCAYVPQSDGVLLDLTVLGNVTCPDPHVAPVPQERALDWLDLVGLRARASSAASDLSLAERRRVALARALSRQKPLLILDGDFDHTLDALLRDLLATVPHLCSVLTTSCVADMRVWKADRVGVVEGSRLIAVGTMGDLVSSLDPDVRAALSWTMA